PQEFELSQNYPNPFNPATKIRYTLPEAGNVKLVVYNLLGEQVEELVNEFKEAGVHTINFNAENLNSGVYIYKIELNGFTDAKKMQLVK
ncbi:MAG: T9SS type A sorting domain-containing protein, partial [Ignavibacteria bacterium]|nr:T9SS type A sorting domain-containing protein [Ignavibacteria bacterium]